MKFAGVILLLSLLKYLLALLSKLLQELREWRPPVGVQSRFPTTIEKGSSVVLVIKSLYLGPNGRPLKMATPIFPIAHPGDFCI